MPDSASTGIDPDVDLHKPAHQRELHPHPWPVLIAISTGGVLGAGNARAGLIDRYLVHVAPTIVGGGTRALPDAARVDLVLHSERRFVDGTVMLDYRTR